MPQPDRVRLQDLVDAPLESLDIEYKSALDLTLNDVRADLARHIAAIANFGGEAIIFGFDDDMHAIGGEPCEVNRDVVAGIVQRYLEPAFQCDVLVIRSGAGNAHPVISIPSHGASPICARANGPEVRGRVQGISQGVYYTRLPGPQSAPITTSQQWAPLIRRAAMHKRSAILGALDVALRGAAPEPRQVNRLAQWHAAAHSAFLVTAQTVEWQPPLANSHFQFSYFVESSDNQVLDPNSLERILMEINGEVHDLVRTGWSMFHPFGRLEIAPYFNTDTATGLGEDDFLECNLLRDERARRIGMDFWRVSANGTGSLIREYWEDSEEYAGHMRVQRGSVLSPNLLVRSLAEFVRHARGMTERFASPVSVSFRCEWWGLDGRSAADSEGMWFRSQPSRTDHRISSGTWPVGALTANWQEIVAALAAPVSRALGVGDTVTTQWVSGQAGRWLR